MQRLVAVAAVVFCALPALAQEGAAEAPIPGVREHDGLFVQVQAGPVFLNLFDARSSITGPGLGAQLLAGLSPTRNVVVFAELLHHEALGLRAARGTEEASLDDGRMSFSYAGPGVAYYFGDSGVHLGGGCGLALVGLDSGRASDGAAGFGLRAGVGKEWWVSDQLALGVAFQFFTAAVELDDGTGSLNRVWAVPHTGEVVASGGPDDHAAQSYAITLTATYQ